MMKKLVLIPAFLMQLNLLSVLKPRGEEFDGATSEYLV